MSFLILAFNAWVRLHFQSASFPPEGIWLSLAIGVLMVNYYFIALAAGKAGSERRRLSAENAVLQQREHEAVKMQLRSAQIAEGLRFTGLPRKEFADLALHHLITELGACAATLYDRVDDAAGAGLVPLATYAVDLPRLRRQRIALDEGLVGTCARDRKLIELHSVPEAYFEIVSGLGRGSPQHLYILPLSFHGQLAGVMEFALTQRLESRELNLLERSSEVLAASLLVARRSGN